MTPADFVDKTTDQLVWQICWVMWRWLAYMTFAGVLIGLSWQYLERSFGRIS